MRKYLDSEMTKLTIEIDKLLRIGSKYDTGTVEQVCARYADMEALIPFFGYSFDEKFSILEIGYKNLLKKAADSDKKLIQMMKSKSYFSNSPLANYPKDIFFNLMNTVDFPTIEWDRKDSLKLNFSNFRHAMRNLTSKTDRLKVYKRFYRLFDKHKPIVERLLSLSLEIEYSYNDLNMENLIKKKGLTYIELENYIKEIKGSTFIFYYKNKLKENLGLNQLGIEDLNYEGTVKSGLCQLATEKLIKKACTILGLNEEAEIIINHNNLSSKENVLIEECINLYNRPPILYMDFKNNMNSQLTFAHELGHGLHYYLSNSNQRFFDSKPHEFLIEVPSILIEMFVLYTLHKEKVYTPKIIETHLLNEIKNTFVMQAFYADFELTIHKLFNNGTLNVKSLDDSYITLLASYLGEDVELYEETKFGWMFLFHLFSPFQSYQYFYCYLVSINLFLSIIKYGDDRSHITNFKKFLKSGSTNSMRENLRLLDAVDIKQQSIDALLMQFIKHFCDKK
ncbi:M3 family metallopeptidase [Shouchella clausii]|uniref:M3 family metallopeptidase n=1 Tax=Shouchella clausii TaxID=79880 RepID=UPI0039838FD8